MAFDYAKKGRDMALNAAQSEAFGNRAMNPGRRLVGKIDEAEWNAPDDRNQSTSNFFSRFLRGRTPLENIEGERNRGMFARVPIADDNAHESAGYQELMRGLASHPALAPINSGATAAPLMPMTTNQDLQVTNNVTNQFTVNVTEDQTRISDQLMQQVRQATEAAMATATPLARDLQRSLPRVEIGG